jgi:hypothetical protein
VGCAVAAGALVATADASREATPAERAQLFRVSEPARYVRDQVPLRCGHVTMRVSNDRAYALVAPKFSASADCSRFGSNGYELFRRTPPAWTRVFVGSDPPPCSYAVPRDLTPCLKGSGPGPRYRSAVTTVAKRGYAATAAGWDEEADFNALVGRATVRGTRTVRVFFFRLGRLVGWDTQRGRPRVSYAWRGDDVIALRYFASRPSVQCRSPTEVRFVLRGRLLLRLDRLPTDAGCRR